MTAGQHGILPADHALTPETRERLAGIRTYWGEALAKIPQPANPIDPVNAPPPPRHAVEDFALPDLQGAPDAFPNSGAGWFF